MHPKSTLDVQNRARIAPWRLLDPLGRPSAPQEHTGAIQERSKSVPRNPKDGPQVCQERLKSLFDAPRARKRGSDSAPSETRERPRDATREFERVSKRG